MAAGYWPGCNWRGAEGAIFGALPPPLRSGGAIDEPSENPGCKRARDGCLRQKAVSDAWCVVEGAGAWRREVAERRPFLASPAAEKGSQIAKRNSLCVI
ncbi:hypothetical protein N7497_003926 [Penicillium chrysogenum]|nr:hypothetical protein N7497_003926 [Penicillium chrysogenum]